MIHKIKAEIERLKAWQPIATPSLDKLLSFIDSLKEEPVNEELEEAAIMHYKDVMEYEAKTGLKPAYMTSFKAGANWQKQQIMSKAVSLVVKEFYGEGDEVAWLIRPSKILDKKFHIGDKVKIILIKEE